MPSLLRIAVFPDLVRPIQDVLGLSGEGLGRLSPSSS